MCIQKIFNWLFGEPIPNEWEKVDWTFVLDKLIEVYPFAKIYLRDRYYYICPKQTIVDFLAMDKTDKERYLSEIFDCDDFSFRLMGQFDVMPYSALAFGIAWSRTHAYNVVVVTNEGVFVVEPQSDEMLKVYGGLYNTELIII